MFATNLIAMNAAPVDYTLPEGSDQKLLMKSAVLVTCGVSMGTGFAVGPRHIATAAHVVAGCKMRDIKTECISFNTVSDRYSVPALEAR